MTDVSAGFRPPCWCPSRWAPTWRLRTNLYKFGENVSPHIFHKKNCCDLNLGEGLCISTFFLFPDSGLNLSNGFDFLFWSILNSVTLKTSNSSQLPLKIKAVDNKCRGNIACSCRGRYPNPEITQGKTFLYNLEAAALLILVMRDRRTKRPSRGIMTSFPCLSSSQRKKNSALKYFEIYLKYLCHTGTMPFN